MPKQKSRKAEERRATKGVITTAKETGGKLLQGAQDLLFGRESLPSQGEITVQNRQAGEEIIAALEVVDFSGLKNKEGVSGEAVENLRQSARACIVKIKNAPTIFDDLSELDSIMESAAGTLKTAAEKGYVDQAEWCINAISTGLLYLRDNVPSHRAEYRDEIIRNRIEYMRNYQNLIVIYGHIAEVDESIQNMEKDIAQFEEEYAPMRDQIRALNNTPEGIRRIARINQSIADPHLDTEDKALVEKVTRAGDLASSITRLRNQQYAAIMEKEALMAEAMGFRTALNNRPGLFDQNMLGEYAAILEKINETTNRMLVEAAATQEIEQAAADKMERIMSGEANQKLVRNAARTIESILIPKEYDNTRTFLEAQIFKAKQAHSEQQRILQQQKLEELLNQTPVQADYDTDADFNFNEATEENTDTAVDSTDQALYNINS